MFLIYTASQASVATKNVAVGTTKSWVIPAAAPSLTSTPHKYGVEPPPFKRARLELDDSSIEVPEPEDSTYNPDDSVLTESSTLL